MNVPQPYIVEHAGRIIATGETELEFNHHGSIVAAVTIPTPHRHERHPIIVQFPQFKMVVLPGTWERSLGTLTINCTARVRHDPCPWPPPVRTDVKR